MAEIKEFSRQQLYRPIERYQTRIIRLHARSEQADSRVVCDLYTATLIDTHFEGVVIAELPADNGNGTIVHYEALSYTWGSPGTTFSIDCNGLDFPVSENLYTALRDLRPPQGEFRYLWVDAICIAQMDDEEKSFQVANMYLIFLKSREVIIWLGSSDEDIDFALDAAARQAEAPFDAPASKEEFWRIHSGLHKLYARPWFRRLWVQQELFAARRLQMMCGRRSFTWSTALDNPDNWLFPSMPEPRIFSKSPLWPELGRSITAFHGSGLQRDEKWNAVLNLQVLHQKNLRCYYLFRSAQTSPDFVETLLDTGGLEAENPLDYVYAILQMTSFPSKALTMDEWLTCRGRMRCIPIDYKASIRSLLCAVTWNLLMEFGLEMLGRFKVFPDPSDSRFHQSLPSWVIDWRLASTVLSRARRIRKATRLAKPWDRVDLAGGELPDADGEIRQGHLQFVLDNSKASFPIDKLVVRGCIEWKLQAEDDGNNRRPVNEARDERNIGVTLHHGDLVVWLLSSACLFTKKEQPLDEFSRRYATKRATWLLRPLKGDTYKLLGALDDYSAPDPMSFPYLRCADLDMANKVIDKPSVAPSVQEKPFHRHLSMTYKDIDLGRDTEDNNPGCFYWLYCRPSSKERSFVIV